MTTTTVPTVAERVQSGAAWLDEHEPGWVDRIDLDRLNLASPCRCVLGQLHGNFHRALGAKVGFDQVAARGFSSLVEERPERPDDYDEFVLAIEAEFAELTQAWRDLIAERRAGGVR